MEEKKESRLVIESVPWCDKVARSVAKSAGSEENLKAIEAEVISGVARVWWCHGGENHGHMITRLENKELVLIVGEGKGFDAAFPYVLAHVEKHNLSFRTHVKRKGLIRMYKKYGVLVDEYVTEIINGERIVTEYVLRLQHGR